MSDLEDLDTGPELPDDEPAAPHADPLAAEGGKRAPVAVDKGMLVKVAMVLGVVVVGGGVYGMLSSHHEAPSKIPLTAKLSSANQAKNIASITGGAVSANAPSPSAANNVPKGGADNMMPPSIAPADDISAPPPSGQLSNASGSPASPSAPAMPASAPASIDANIPGTSPSPTGAAAPASIDANIPGTTPSPSAAPAIPSAASATASAPSIPTIPGTPAAAPTVPTIPTTASATPSIPTTPPAATPSIPDAAAPVPFKADATATAQPATPAAVTPPAVKNGMPMQSAPVTPVDQADLNKAPDNAALTPAPTADSAKVEELQNEIVELKKTIAQLQSASVTKEDNAATSAEAAANGEAPKAHRSARHNSSHHRAHTAGAAHGNGGHWVLRAAKPGVAWVAKKGSDDLQMVNVGDTLAGVGTVTSISQDSMGQWVIDGSRGHIHQ